MTLNIKKSAKVFVAAFAALLLLSSIPANAQPEGGDAVHANLESISLAEFIKFVGRYTGRNIVFQKGALPGTHISIYAGQSLTEPELMAVFQQVLSGAGFYAVTRDNVTYILRSKDARTITPDIRSSAGEGTGEEIITSVFQLDGKMSPAKAEELLQPFSSQIGSVKAVPVADSVLARDLQENIVKMRKLLNIVQRVGAGRDTKIIDLVNSNAKSVAAKLESFYKKLASIGKVGDAPVVEAVEWANSLLISGSKDQIRTVSSLVSKLDRSSEAYSKLKVYRLHNTEAEVAGEVLQSLLVGGSVKSSSSVAKGGAAKNKNTGGLAAAASNDSGIQVSADKTTNSLLVMADQDQLKQIDEFVDKIDQAQDQVYIEALVLETTLNNAKEFGVEWMSGADVGSGFSNFGFMKSKDSNLKSYVSPVIDGDGPNVSAMPGGFSMGVLGNLISYGGKSYPSISALVNFTKSASDFNLISAPQIMTLDNSEAEIFIGENRPYKTGESSTSGDSVVASYQYKDVGIKLELTPHINREEGLIKLELFQTYNTVSSTAGTLELPVTSDRKTKTTVLMADGSTMVIGGLIQSDKSRSQGAVPYLSDLPLLGWLFKQQEKSSNKKTLMVFVSARIIRTTEQLEALSKSKLNKYRNQRTRFNTFIESEFNNFKNESEDDPATQSPEAGI